MWCLQRGYCSVFVKIYKNDFGS
uniref:Uncharacterized protein n=1 Tax=Anguilla anguilla TaxID=7936 RepID=A0A0E9V6F4_ANGAN